jgi:hypothetical protein
VAEVGIGLAFPVETAAGCDVCLTSDDGLHTVLPAGLVEWDRPVEDAVIRESYCGKLMGSGAGSDVFDTAGTIEKAVLGMYVKVCEARAAIRG